MHHKVVGNFGSEADVRSLYHRRLDSMKLPTSGACTHGRPREEILTELRPRYVKNEPDFQTLAYEVRALTFEVTDNFGSMTYYLVVHTGPGLSVPGKQKVTVAGGLRVTRSRPERLGQSQTIVTPNYLYT